MFLSPRTSQPNFSYIRNLSIQISPLLNVGLPGLSLGKAGLFYNPFTEFFGAKPEFGKSLTSIT